MPRINQRCAGVDCRSAAGKTRRAFMVQIQFHDSQGVVPVVAVLNSSNGISNTRREAAEATPNFGVSPDTNSLQGMAKTGDQVGCQQDTDRVLG